MEITMADLRNLRSAICREIAGSPGVRAQGKSENRAPGVLGTTHNRPSWASMIERQIDSPIPMPPDFVVNSGLNTRSISCELIPVPVSATEILDVAVVTNLRLDG